MAFNYIWIRHEGLDTHCDRCGIALQQPGVNCYRVHQVTLERDMEYLGDLPYATTCKGVPS